jgi:meiotically up-regulated gene 157 (Mug157) protein
MSLAIQGLTSQNTRELTEVLRALQKSTARTNLMHEGFKKDSPWNYSRPWFGWANSLFAELILTKLDEIIAIGPAVHVPYEEVPVPTPVAVRSAFGAVKSV